MTRSKSKAKAKAKLAAGYSGVDQPKPNSSPTSKKKLHLTTMPPDILIQIWAHFEWDKKTPGPICKAFLPYQRPLPFRRITLSGPDHFGRLQAVLTAEPTLGSYCRDLHISMSDGEENVISSRDLKRFFYLLVNLKTISFYHYPLGAMLLLSPEVAQECFRELEEADFSDCIDEPWSIYQNLGYYKNLKELVISNYGGLGGMTFSGPPPVSVRVEQQSPVAGPFLHNISWFHWEGGWTTSTSDAFLPSMPSLKTFLLYNSNCTAATLVYTLKALPSSLSTLGIAIEHRRALKGPKISIDEELARFQNLETLILNTLYITPSIFRHLQYPLPLQFLKFGEHTKAIIHQDNILKLLDPASPLHNSTLKKMDLSSLRGPTIDEDGTCEWVLESVLEEFQDPKWIEGQMDLTGVQAIVELGKNRGVNVYGSVVGLLKVAMNDLEAFKPREFSDNDSYSDSGSNAGFSTYSF